jgi:hypothetical protein
MGERFEGVEPERSQLLPLYLDDFVVPGRKT